MSNIDLTPIFQALIVLVAALITRYVVPWIKAKTTLDQRREIRDLVSILVFAAESCTLAPDAAKRSWHG